MESLINTVKSAALNVGQYMMPILRESKFKETGVLTPEEFVLAGDYLSYHCSTWSWAKSVDSSKTKSYLPEDKQFLITRNVPSYRRCIDMEYDPSQEKVLSNKEVVDEDGFTDMGSEDDGWVDTHHFAPEGAPRRSSLSAPSKPVDLAGNEEDDDDAPAMDMDAFVAQGGLEDVDPNRFVRNSKCTTGDAEGDAIMRTRTYDLHITYDKYYQVPRFWLCGYNEANEPLNFEEMGEDFSQDHINKTITFEMHPHFNNTSMASIHPCRHAEVMKRLIEQLAESGRELTVDQYLIIFLKFVQAVIPTIEYDYTRSIHL